MSLHSFSATLRILSLAIFLLDPKKKIIECPLPMIEPILGFTFDYDDLPSECVNTLISMYDNCLNTINDIEQVERTLMDKLFWSERPVIKTVVSGEKWLLDLREKMEIIKNQITPQANEYLIKFEKYIEFLNQDVRKIVKGLTGEIQPEEENEEDNSNKKDDDEEEEEEEDTFDVKIVHEEILNHMALALEIESEISNQFIRIGMFQINTLDIRNLLANKHRTIAERLRGDISTKIINEGKQLDNEFKKIFRKLGQNPENVEMVAELHDFMDEAKEKIKSNQATLNKMDRYMSTLDSHKHESPDSFRALWYAKAWPKKMTEQLHMCEEVLLEKKAQYAEEQREGTCLIVFYI